MTIEKQIAYEGNGIQDAIQETPSEKMDRIIEVHEQWETVNLLIKLMNRELKIPDTAQPTDVRQAMDNLQKKYHEAMKEWRLMREQQTITKTIDTMTPELVKSREK